MTDGTAPTPLPIDQTIAGRHYATAGSTLIAWGDFTARAGQGSQRLVFLLRTAEGYYFAQRQTQDGDEVCAAGCSLQPLSLDEAVRLYADLAHSLLPVEDAFPPD
jgi:hypothetical protein